MKPSVLRLGALAAVVVFCCISSASAHKEIDNWGQCGGNGGNCVEKGLKCADAPYPWHKCKEGWTCVRKDKWYWQCLECKDHEQDHEHDHDHDDDNEDHDGDHGHDNDHNDDEDDEHENDHDNDHDNDHNEDHDNDHDEDDDEEEDDEDDHEPKKKVIAAWGQCGGKGGDCGKYKCCADKKYRGHKCAKGYKCMRKDEWYWQCKEKGQKPEKPEEPKEPEKPDDNTIQAWGQCGGKGGECDAKKGKACDDKAFKDFKCAKGYKCMRQDEWYWQCKM